MVLKDATPLMPLAHERNSIFKHKQIESMMLDNQKNKTTQWCSTGRHFTTTKHKFKTHTKPIIQCVKSYLWLREKLRTEVQDQTHVQVFYNTKFFFCLTDTFCGVICWQLFIDSILQFLITSPLPVPLICSDNICITNSSSRLTAVLSMPLYFLIFSPDPLDFE